MQWQYLVELKGYVRKLMTLEIAVIELGADTEHIRGKYEFLSVLSPGDIIPITGPGGASREFFCVHYVGHNPIALPKNKFTEGSQPWIAVYIEFAWRQSV